MKILAVGDSFVPIRLFELGLANISIEQEVRFIQLEMEAPFIPTTPSERAITEYAGNPQQLVDALNDEEMLLVHGAPVTDAVMDASPNLRVVGVARGGPVNIDLAAASERGIAVITAPARNAEAVADITLAFMIMLARGMKTGVEFVTRGGRVGVSAFEGAQFFGNELGGHILGLVGYGNVGARVARRAHAFGTSILVYDPYIAPEKVKGPGIRMTGLEELLANSDFVSLHARVTPETINFFDGKKFSAMKQGSYFINSARETLVDEAALYEALISKHLAGAALDVLRQYPESMPSPLVFLPNVIVTPHIGGATHEAALRGVQILASQVDHYLAGQPMEHVANRDVTGSSR